MATSINHDMDQGANFSFTVTATNTDGTAKGITSGYAAFSQMRKFYSSSTAIKFATSITGATGNIKVSLGATASAGVKAGVYLYDVELHGLSSGSEPYTVMRVCQGMITVYPEVTKIDIGTTG